MRGLGRNVKFMMGFLLRFQVKCYLLITIICVLFGGVRHGIKSLVNETIPFYLFVSSLTFILVCAMSYSDMYYNTMVSQGSARKPAALGMLLSQYIFTGMQLVILFTMAMITENNWSLAIKTCPLGLLAVCFIILAVGVICATLSMSGHNVWAVCLLFTFIIAGIALVVIIGFRHDFTWSAEMVKPYNNLWFLAAGVVLEVIGSIAYYKTVQKVDLKLA